MISLRHYVSICRPYQWVKNLLIFLPLLLSHQYMHMPSLYISSITFVAFCLLVSSVYCINDLVDLENDKQHPLNKYRALASGHITKRSAFLLSAVLMCASFTVGFLASHSIVMVLAGYLVLTTVYTFFIKKIIAGLYIIESEFSLWFLVFSLFSFFTLATLKRCIELSLSKTESLAGRPYTKSDMPILINMGITASFISTLIFGLYLNSERVISLYQHPILLWILLPMMMAWFCKIWIELNRGTITKDPIRYVFKDAYSYVFIVLSIAIVVSAH